MFHPLLGWPETACGLHMTRVFQIGIIGLCANQGSGKRSISISGTGVFTLTVGVFFRSWTQIVLCWVKLKAGALGSTIIKGKPAQRNKAFHLLEDHLIVSPALASQFHHRDSVILNDSKSISLLSPSGIGCHEAKTSVLRNSLGIIKDALFPLPPAFTSVLAQEGCQTQHLGKPAYCNGQLSCSHFWLGSLEPHFFTNTSCLASLPPFPRISFPELDEEPWGQEGENNGYHVWSRS